MLFGATKNNSQIHLRLFLEDSIIFTLMFSYFIIYYQGMLASNHCLPNTQSLYYCFKTNTINTLRQSNLYVNK